MGVCNCSMFCYTLLQVYSSFAIILMGKRELFALLSLSSWCLVVAVWLFLGVPCVCLQFVIVVFPDKTHYFPTESFQSHLPPSSNENKFSSIDTPTIIQFYGFYIFILKIVTSLQCLL